MDRRTFLSVSAALAATQLRSNAFDMQSPQASFDHVIFAISDLETGIRIIKEKTGVEAVVGGVHPDLGTHNALLSLGEDVYLEILAPVPNGRLVVGYKFITELHEGRLIRWAAHTNNIDAIRKAADAGGYQNTGVNAGKRNTPQGTTLNWKTLFARTPVDEVMPFFIQWEPGTPHPATTSPKGCTLRSFTVSHPDAAAVNKVFSVFGLNADVVSGPAGMKMTIGTPKGVVVL